MGARRSAAILNDLPTEPSRAGLRARHRCAEAESLAELARQAPLAPARWAAAQQQARRWIAGLRGARSRGSGVDALMREFSLSSQEGVALMCLAEALARIPDRATADALIRDKLAQGDWRAHVGSSRSIFVNAAAWGLMLTGKLVATHSEAGLGSAVNRLIARGGEPLIRAGVEIAMRLLGQQFVLGRTIELALQRARETEARGYRHSYDMLGEAALNAADAQRYFEAYAQAIDAIGASVAAPPGAPPPALDERPGISVKLSALHPRFVSAQADRLRRELGPRIQELCRRARRWGIGLNIDAEESERLEPTLDLFVQLARDPALADWDGLGIVVQAYQKRAVALVDWLAELAAQTGRRFMVRLVKGAYWDSEIKRAQIQGLDDFPVFTRKAHTDVSYLVCARHLLRHPDRLYAQFATHNALTLASVLQLADEAGVSRFELQCLHGMGESLYDMALPDLALPAPGGAGAARCAPACRIYAPVGSHETLLAYLVRRLLENGANSSFVNRVVDETVPVEQLLEDPLAASRRAGGAPHPAIALPADLFAPAAGAAPGTARRNSRGMDLDDAPTVQRLLAGLRTASARSWTAYPILAADRFAPDTAEPLPVSNPARRAQIVGTVQFASAQDIESALAAAQDEAWSRTDPQRRAQVLEAIADALEQRRVDLIWLAVCEAGKTLGDAVSEVREAVDFCRYYAQQARALGPAQAVPLGVVVAISPWNFPLAIFTGQVSAALAAGNRVLAKPAEQTPLIAALAVRLMHAAGVQRSALQLLPGDGTVGARLTGDARVHGVLFTGSTEVAALIDRALADCPGACEPLLVAETGGQNAMIVDSSAQPEQVVQDAVLSAFGSAGQRCSALRVLCLQEEIADSVLAMLLGAVDELRLGDPAELATDLGPVIDEAARQGIETHLALAPAERRLLRRPLPPQCAQGSFVAPAIVQIDAIGELGREVFGPVLHVLRYRREALGELLEAINATGYALTCGIHSRIDETIEFIVTRIRAGNIYVNRNMIGAVVGVQPFGGEGLSGTGPKAGGPWTVPRLTKPCPAGFGGEPFAPPDAAGLHWAQPPAPLAALLDWARQRAMAPLEQACERYLRYTPLRWRRQLPGPTGESNELHYRGRGTVLCLQEPVQAGALLAQLAAVLASGNRALLLEGPEARAVSSQLPAPLREGLHWTGDWRAESFEAVLFCGPDEAARHTRRRLAQREGARIAFVRAMDGAYALERLVAEQVVSTNTAAAGGNASLMSLQPA
jgi:RHH-type proline utilization regulon transcriptional repressor/proline dehydrogenase/delta 1-pyrroline-5-carboxylate dehydrogenase